ncbi:MAG: ABC transporter substrate-binding protein [Candidatus Velthaea sp.]|jgi:branched-chain amino acid transport system substrate-binding protein
MKRPALLTLAAFAACALALPTAAATTSGPATGKTVKVGVIADVTGSAAVYGVMQKNAYELANDDIKSGLIDAGGANLSFDVEDSASDPNQVANLFQRFSTDGTPVILGPTLSGEAKKGDPIAVRAGTPVVGTSTTAEGITALGPLVFRVSLSEAQVIPTTVARTRALWKYKTAALIYGDDNAFTKTDGDIFKAQLERAGVTIVDTETFHIGDKDFSAALTKIKAANPEVIAIGALFPEATKIIQQAGTLGVKIHMVGGNGLNSPQMYEVAGPAAQGVVVGAAWALGGNYTGNRSFVERFTKRYGTAPDQFAAQAYAAAQLIAQLVKEGKTTKGEFGPALRELKLAQTVLGPIAFDVNRDVKAAPVILQIVKGGFAYFH